MSTEEILEEVAAEVSTCTKCDLCKGRTKAVPGEGEPTCQNNVYRRRTGFP